MTVDGSSEEDGLGPVRPYAVVRGRARPRRDLPSECVLRPSAAPPATPLQPDHARLMVEFHTERDHPFRSVAEVAARTAQPLQVARILLDDLIEDGYLVAPAPAGLFTTEPACDSHLLERVLDGLHKL